MISSGRFDPLPFSRAMMLARAGSFATTMFGMPSSPEDRCCQLRISAWKWRMASSSSLATAKWVAENERSMRLAK